MESHDILGDEGRMAVNACVKVSIFEHLREYTRDTALQRLWNCCAQLPSALYSLDLLGRRVLPEKDKNGRPKNTYNIMDIHRALSELDEMGYGEICPKEGSGSKEGAQWQEEHEDIDFPAGASNISDIEEDLDEGFSAENDYKSCRAAVEREYAEPIHGDEIDHGSGFIINENLLITCRHVIEDTLSDKTKEIRICNAAIGELSCEVVRCDVRNDLALLHCKDLNLKGNGICPLQLSAEVPLQGMSIFTFGYPLTYAGETALLVTGYVSTGSVERYGRPPLMVLNCPANHGNSGGPVFCWIKGQLMVVALLVQKHMKDILTPKEKEEIEAMRKKLQTSSVNDLEDDQTRWNVLTLKMYDALETHTQFNLCNAVPGSSIVEFILTGKSDVVCQSSQNK